MMEVRIVEDEAELVALHAAAEQNAFAHCSCDEEQLHHPGLDKMLWCAASKWWHILAAYQEEVPVTFVLFGEEGQIFWMCICKDDEAAQAMHDLTEEIVKRTGQCWGKISNDKLRATLAASSSFGSVIDIQDTLVTCVPGRYKSR